MTHINLIHLACCDGINPDRVTRSEIEGWAKAMIAINALQAYAPGCNAARLRSFGMSIGTRGTRKIDAAYNMTEQDVRGWAPFGDSIGIYSEFTDGRGVLILPTTGRHMHIPYRTMLPNRVKG